jgi:rubredoxin
VINLDNRKKAIDGAMYGPLNPAEPNTKYWKEIASEWRVPVAEAKKQRCGNCAVFIITPEMKSCIEDGLTDNADEFDAIDAAGELGYCEAFDFKCAAARTCRAWIAGGPVTELKEEGK